MGASQTSSLIPRRRFPLRLDSFVSQKADQSVQDELREHVRDLRSGDGALRAAGERRKVRGDAFEKSEEEERHRGDVGGDATRRSVFFFSPQKMRKVVREKKLESHRVTFFLPSDTTEKEEEEEDMSLSTTTTTTTQSSLASSRAFSAPRFFFRETFVTDDKRHQRRGGGGRRIRVLRADASPSLVKPRKALEMIETQKYAYVDVRTKHEFETVGHHKNSTCIPFYKSMGPPPEVNQHFVKEVEAKFPSKDCPLLIGCAAGGRSAKASAALVAAGFTNVADLEGGFKAWASEFGDMIETGCGC